MCKQQSQASFTPLAYNRRYVGALTLYELMSGKACGVCSAGPRSLDSRVRRGLVTFVRFVVYGRVGAQLSARETVTAFSPQFVSQIVIVTDLIIRAWQV